MGGALLLLALLLLPGPREHGLTAVLERPALTGAQVSVVVLDASTREVLFTRGHDRPTAPASNMKLLTTAAAVRRLGVDHVFVTSFLAASWPDANGALTGDLVLRGGGDPCLRQDLLRPEGITDPAAFLAHLLADTGLRRVTGQLLLDDTYLDQQWVSPEWEANDLGRAYAAPVGALSLDRNCLQLLVDGNSGTASPRAALTLDVLGYRLRNEVRWSEVRGQHLVGALRPDDDGQVRVQGAVARGVVGAPFEVPVRDATDFAGRRVLGCLGALGIQVDGGLGRVVAPLPGLVELARFETPLDLAVIITNKESDNSVADHLFKVLGAELDGDGSFAGGGRALACFLAEDVGLDPKGLVAMDGSGLAPSNRVTALMLARTLAAMHSRPGPDRDLFLRSLPVAGLDGTLNDRLRDPPYRGAVRAKTGYIRGVSSLSGLAWTRSGRVLAFSILISDFRDTYRNRDMKAIQDDLCRELIDRW